jgi:hypothetical protein
MNSSLTPAALLAVALLAVNCTTTPSGVRTNVTPNVAWASYRTFAIQAATNTPPADAARAAARDAVRQTINDAFLNRGLKPAAVTEADLEVVVMGKFVPDNPYVQQTTLLTRGGNLQVDYSYSDQAVPRAMASLAIALVDNRQKKVVWSAGTDKQVYNKQPTVAQAVDITNDLLAQLPSGLVQAGSLGKP